MKIYSKSKNSELFIPIRIDQVFLSSDLSHVTECHFDEKEMCLHSLIINFHIDRWTVFYSARNGLFPSMSHQKENKIFFGRGTNFICNVIDFFSN